MAEQGNTLALTIEAKNLTGPTFSALRNALKGLETDTGGAATKVESSGAKITSSFSQVEGNAKTVVGSIASGLGVAVPLSMAAAATAAIAFGVSSAKSFADFEKSMRAVGTLSSEVGAASEKSFASNSAQVRQFAVAMGVDAKSAADGLYQVLSAGIPAGKEAFGVLETGSKAAVGGLTSTKTAVDGLTSIMNAYKLGAKDAGAVSDQMFATVKIGKLSYEELASSVGAVVPIAAAAGIGFKEVGGFMANMTLSGNSASVSANSLRQVITSIIKPTADAQNAAKALGLDFSEAGLRSKGLAGFLKEVGEATGGSSELLSALFSDVDGLKGVISSIGPNMQGFQNAIDGVGNSAGEADHAFDEMNKSTARQWEQMAAKANELKLRLGQSLIAPMGEVVKQIDAIGTSLGLWPSDVPTRDQIDRMIALGTGARNTAQALGILAAAWEFLKGPDNAKTFHDIADAAERAKPPIVRLGDAYKAGKLTVDEYLKALKDLQAAYDLIAEAEARDERLSLDAALARLKGADAASIAAARTANWSTEVTDAEKALSSAAVGAGIYHERLGNLNKLLESGAIDQDEYKKRLTQLRAELTASSGATTAANATFAEQSRLFAAGQISVEEFGNSLLSASNSLESLTRPEFDARVKELTNAWQFGAITTQDYRDQVKKLAEVLERTLSQATKTAASDAKRAAEETVRANESALRSWQKLGEDVQDIETDSGARILNIRQQHDQDYNQAIIDATAEQTRIKENAVADIAKIESDAAMNTIRAQSALMAWQTNADEASLDRKRRLARAAEDLAIQQQQRDEDRRRAADARQQDRDRANHEAFMALKDLEAEYGHEGSGGKSKADADKALAKAEADSKKRLDRDRAEEQKRNDREVRDENQRHERALRDAKTAADFAAEDEKHTDAVAKENERHQDALDKIKQREDDDREQRDETHQEALDRIKEQFDTQEARIKQTRDERLKSIDAQEKAQAASDKVQDEREKARRDLQTARDTEDYERQRTAAGEKLKQDLANVETKRAADVAAVEAKRDADIQASNDALTKKQGQIDAKRDEDFGKFSKDLDRRFRELEQQFDRTVKAMDASIPDMVKRLLGGASDMIGATSGALKGQMDSGSSGDGAPEEHLYNAGDTLPSGYQTQEGDTVINDRGQVRVWRDGAIVQREDVGAGAGRSAPSATFVDILGQLQNDLSASQRAAAELRGGDFRPGGATPGGIPALGGTTESALAWMQSQLGRADWVGMCERFVENAFGLSGQYASARDAMGAMMSSAGGSLDSAPRGAMVFFKPDPSNGYYGHVGMSLGGGRFISSTSGGVEIAGASPYWSKLYAGYGAPSFPRRITGGPVLAGESYVVGEAGRPEVFTPAVSGTVGDNTTLRQLETVGGGGGRITIQLNVHGNYFMGDDLAQVRKFARLLKPELESIATLRLRG